MTYRTFDPTPELLDKLKDQYRYEPISGRLYNRKGRRVGYVNHSTGYRKLGVLHGGRKHELFVHTIAFFLMTGRWPRWNEQIDHRDRNKVNDSWSNLRLASCSENMMNRVTPVGVVGYRGITLEGSRYRARITAKGIDYHLGNFASLESALERRLQAEHALHGQWSPNFGK